MLLKLTKNYTITKGMLDCNGFLKLESILDLFQTIAQEHAEMLSIGDEYLKTINSGWILARTNVEVKKHIKNIRAIEITTYPSKTDKFEYVRNYEISINDEVIIYGASIFVLFNFQTKRISRIDLFDKYDDSSFVSDRYFKKIEKPLFDKDKQVLLSKYVVLHDDIDTYNHMNNAKYAKIIMEQYDYSMDFVNCIKISYVRQSLYNDEIMIYKYVEANTTYISGSVDNSTTFISTINNK